MSSASVPSRISPPPKQYKSILRESTRWSAAPSNDNDNDNRIYSQQSQPHLRQNHCPLDLDTDLDAGEMSAWRQDGREVRQKMLEEDELNGGSDFHINQMCPLRNYCAIADRVQDQFLAAYKSPSPKLHETYIMGNRLIKFLSTVLPTHYDYQSTKPECVLLRIKIENDLEVVREQVLDVALSLDEIVYKEAMRRGGTDHDDDNFSEKSAHRLNIKENEGSIQDREKQTKERTRKVRFDLMTTVQEYEHEAVATSQREAYRGYDREMEFDKDKNEDEDEDENENGFEYVGAHRIQDDLDHDNHYYPEEPEFEGKNEFEVAQDHLHEHEVEPGHQTDDLAIWADKDPAVDIDLSSLLEEEEDASEDGSSFDATFDLAYSFEEHCKNSVKKRCESEMADSPHDDGMKNERMTTRTLDKIEESSMLDLFSGADDGWEHFNGEASATMEWPDLMDHHNHGHGGNLGIERMMTGLQSHAYLDGEEQEQEKKESAGESSPPEVHFILDSGSDSDNEYDDHHDDTRHEYHHDDQISLSSEEDVSFVQKIARENYNRAIDEFQEEDDSDAADSWAQNESDGEQAIEDEDRDNVHCEEPQAEEEVPSENSIKPKVVTFGQVLFEGGDRAEISTPENHYDVDDKAQEDGEVPIQCQTEGTTGISGFTDLREKSQSLEYSSSNESSASSCLNYSLPSASSKEVLSMPDEFDCNELDVSNPDIHLMNLQDEFDNSQIIAESPDGFNLGDEEDLDHDELIKMTELEFNDDVSPCDSSGGEKTISTASTAETYVMAADGHTSDSSGSSCGKDRNILGSTNGVLGIARREGYSSTFDGSQPSTTQLGFEIDYLESKVKNLKEKKESETTLTKSRYPVQMAKNNVSSDDIHVFFDDIKSHVHIIPSTLEEGGTNTSAIMEHERNPAAQHRRHPTAARLKVLKQSNAWKRRYGRAAKT